MPTLGGRVSRSGEAIAKVAHSNDEDVTYRRFGPTFTTQAPSAVAGDRKTKRVWRSEPSS